MWVILLRWNILMLPLDLCNITHLLKFLLGWLSRVIGNLWLRVKWLHVTIWLLDKPILNKYLDYFKSANLRSFSRSCPTLSNQTNTALQSETCQTFLQVRGLVLFPWVGVTQSHVSFNFLRDRLVIGVHIRNGSQQKLLFWLQNRFRSMWH